MVGEVWWGSLVGPRAPPYFLLFFIRTGRIRQTLVFGKRGLELLVSIRINPLPRTCQEKPASVYKGDHKGGAQQNAAGTRVGTRA